MCRVQAEPLAVIDIPACMVTGVVLAPAALHWQTLAAPGLNAALRCRGASPPAWPALAVGWRRAVASRAALELRRGETVNLGWAAGGRGKP